MIRWITGALLAGVLAVRLMAGIEGELTGLMEKKVAEITVILQDKKLGTDEKNKQILKAVDGLFDFELMGMLSLGKQGWSQMDDTQRGEFSKLFTSRIQTSYLEKLHLYTDEKIKVEAGVQGKKGRVEVPSFVLGSDEKTEIRYKFYQTREKKWMIYDVEIAGVSILQTFRAQFGEILKSASVGELIEKMRSAKTL